MLYRATTGLVSAGLLLLLLTPTATATTLLSFITPTGTAFPSTRPTPASTNSTSFLPPRPSASVRYPNTTVTTTVIFTPAQTIPPTNQTTVWTTVPVASLTGDPFCVNQASPQQTVGNHCVCSNGATLGIIPWTKGGNVSDYQPCAYTTVNVGVGGGGVNTTTVVVIGGQ
ncbi:hypothetical protein QBC44DRAFT_369802 [Cladorrhinum sp. PSN332]|nr:hypothetical protein QBC44DRAFT_369802 [Cladorrhinum sp. PSN332]